LNSFTPGL